MPYSITEERRIDSIRPLGTQLREELEAHFRAGYGFKTGAGPIMSGGWTDSGYKEGLPMHYYGKPKEEQCVRIGRLNVYLEDLPRFDDFFVMKEHLVNLVLEIYSWLEDAPN